MFRQKLGRLWYMLQEATCGASAFAGRSGHIICAVFVQPFASSCTNRPPTSNHGRPRQHGPPGLSWPQLEGHFQEEGGKGGARPRPSFGPSGLGRRRRRRRSASGPSRRSGRRRWRPRRRNRPRSAKTRGRRRRRRRGRLA